MDDDRQAALFERLAEATGLTAKEIDRYTGCGNRQAYRLIGGSTPLTFAQTQQLLKHPNQDVGNLITDALLEGTGRICVRINDGQPTNVDRAAIDVLDDCTTFLRRREQDKKDGSITAEEREAEVNVVRDLIRAAYQLAHEVEVQPVVKRASRNNGQVVRY